jgi:xylan 1,4-beta-xylosidase
MFLRLLTCLLGLVVLAAHAESFPVALRVEAAKPLGELKPIWRFFGADEPNYATQPDGRKLLGQLGRLDPGTPVFFRTHNLLTSGDSTAALKWGSTGVYGEDGRGRAIFDWSTLDVIFDAYRQQGLRPYVQLGFMPEAMSVHPFPYRHHWKPGDNYADIYTGWAHPPKDYAKWEELNYQVARRYLGRYGKAEIDQWWWEVWNEPNIPYWKGTPEEYYRLYDHAVAGVRRALPNARVGGPESTGPRNAGAAKFLRDFLEHCLRGTNYATGKVGSPLDFIAFHAKGAPTVQEGHVRMGLAAQLQDFDAGFGLVASFPELKSLPIVIGESDPDGCAACSSEVYPQNAYRNGALYASYTAASFARAHDLAAKHGVNLAGALTWAFEFEGQPWFAGFRALASRGVELPVLNAFRMMARLHGQRLAVESPSALALTDVVQGGVRGTPDVSALAARDANTVSVLVWHYHDDDVAGPEAEVTVSIAGLTPDSRWKLRHYRVDETHSNAFTVWQKQGAPQQPTPPQLAELTKAAALAELESSVVTVAADGTVPVHFLLPRQGLSLLVLQPGAQ